MFQSAAQDIGDDLHVTMGMGVKPPATRDCVVVQNPQAPESHVLGMKVTGKGERVVGVQPAMIRVPPILCFSN
jgi:hypothetical protein